VSEWGGRSDGRFDGRPGDWRSRRVTKRETRERQQHVESEICEIDLGLATRFGEKLLYRCKYERATSRVGINSGSAHFITKLN
jgi:hypothetical protein